MFRYTLLILLACCSWLGGQAQTVVLDAQLQGSTFEETENELTGWTLNNSEIFNDEGTYRLQIGTSTIKTPALSNLFGTGKIVLFANSIGGTATLNVSVDGDGELSQTSFELKQGWQRLPAFHLKKANPHTKICFSATTTIMISKLLITDIGNAVYYETFDYITSYTGGNDNDFTQIPTNNTNLSISNTDYKLSGSVSGNIKLAKQCIYNYLTTSYFVIPSLGTTSSAMLSFRAASVNLDDDNENVKVEVVIDGTKTTKTFKAPKAAWESYSISLNDVSNYVSVSFNKNDQKAINYFLDDIMISEVGDMTISETANWNNAMLARGKESVYNHYNITLGRSFGKDVWNTLCVPFTVTKSMIQTASSDNAVELRAYDSFENSTKTFNFTSADNIPAGTPFFVKFSKDVENLCFQNVAIDQETPQNVNVCNGYGINGVYQPTALNTDGTHLFMISDGSLRKPTAEGNTIRGLRFYFVVPSGTSSARVALSDEDTGIAATTIESSHEDGKTYNLQGQQVDGARQQRGIYIRNGKKIITK